jgi:hypothetical protein
MSNYIRMWSALGLGLKAHDAILSIPGSVYRDIFPSQKNLPEKMKYFGFVMPPVGHARKSRLPVCSSRNDSAVQQIKYDESGRTRTLRAQKI